MHGSHTFFALPTVIQRIGILPTDPERFQGNRMLRDQAGLVEASRLTAIVSQDHLPIGPQRIELGMRAPGKEMFPIIGGGNRDLPQSFAEGECDTGQCRAVTGLAPTDELIRKITKIGRGND